MKHKTSINHENGNDANRLLADSYLRGQAHVHDNDFADFAEQHGKTQDQVIDDMVNEGWTQGMDVRGNYEYWEGANNFR